jgi:hypothetical protein
MPSSGAKRKLSMPVLPQMMLRLRAGDGLAGMAAEDHFIPSADRCRALDSFARLPVGAAADGPPRTRKPGKGRLREVPGRLGEPAGWDFSRWTGAL